MTGILATSLRQIQAFTLGQCAAIPLTNGAAGLQAEALQCIGEFAGAGRALGVRVAKQWPVRFPRDHLHVAELGRSMFNHVRDKERAVHHLSLIHISEPTRRTPTSYAVFCLQKKKE